MPFHLCSKQELNFQWDGILEMSESKPGKFLIESRSRGIRNEQSIYLNG